ncbi:MAG: DUF933 domain-containing protein [Actinomycetota bacterium]
MARLGIVGFANSGKTSLFNALTGLEAPTAAHPFSTIEPNVGVARVPDDKLELAARAEGSARTVPATLEILDLPPLARSGHPAGPGGQHLARLREMDALAVVLRAFTDESVDVDSSGTDPAIQAEELMLELTVADHEVIVRKGERLQKEATADPHKRAAADVMTEAAAVLGSGEALRRRAWSAEALAAFRDLSPLTLKPMVWVVNVDEDDDHPARLAEAVTKVVGGTDPVVALSARLEEEGARLPVDERAELFESLGLGEGALARIVRATYQSVGLISFYTVGPKETRAWTVRSGASVTEAAGKVHSDLERGFIRAEVASIDDVIGSGGWEETKRAGLVRLEGRSYIVKADDVLVIRFSV